MTDNRLIKGISLKYLLTFTKTYRLKQKYILIWERFNQ